MIYRAPERATPTRSRAVTHELAALLVGMALLAAVILQFACAGGGGGAAGRWLCVNNGRLAALDPTTATPTATTVGQSSGFRAVGVATPSLPGAQSTPTVLGSGVLSDSGSDAGASFPFTTPTEPNPFDLSPPGFGGPIGDPRDPSGALDAYAGVGATSTALAAEALRQATAYALRRPTVELQLPTQRPTEADATPTPGPGTPSVTPQPSPTVLASPTESGYP